MKVRRVHYTQGGVSKLAATLYADFYDHQGVRRRMPLFEDKRNSDEAARAIEKLVNVRACGDVVPIELRRFIESTLPQIREKLAEWHIIDGGLVVSSQVLDELIDEWKTDLLAEDVNTEYAQLKTKPVRTLLRDARMQRWNDIRSDVVREQLKKYRSAEKKPMGVTTSNHYLQAAQQFCRWMVESKKSERWFHHWSA